MKIISLTLGTAMLFTLGSLAPASYANSDHEHATSEKCGHHEHGDGDHAAGHMGHMNDILKRLKRELGDKYNLPVAAATKEQLVHGKTVFTKSCVTCHGVSGKGDGQAAAAFKQKPADFTDPEHSSYYSDQGRIHIIKKGIKGTPMPGWESVLKEKEIQSVYAYIRSLRSSEKKEDHGHSGHSH